jgi:hypothetical protein
MTYWKRNHTVESLWAIFVSSCINKKLSDSSSVQSHRASKRVSLISVCSYGASFIRSQDWVHNAFNYGSHYFQWQSTDNSETRWHHLLMRSMTMCISCMPFVMEMLELHRWNTSIDIQVGGKRKICICNDIRQCGGKRVHSCHQHTLAWADAMSKNQRC